MSRLVHVSFAVAALTIGGDILRAVDTPIRFSSVAVSAGLTVVHVSAPTKDYLIDSVGNGVAWLDYDNDGDLDSLIVNGSTLDRLAQGGDRMVTLYRNDGGRFTDVTAAVGLTRRGWGAGVCVADYDNDGFLDIYVTAYRPSVLWRNVGGRTFTFTGGAADPGWSTGCAFGDYDRDGFVDLFVANYVQFDPATVPKRGSPACRFMGIRTPCGPLPLAGQADTLYRNDGRGSFADVTKRAGVVEPGYYGFGVLFSDLDDDGWMDIYVANDSRPNLLFRNLRNGTFREEGLQAGLAVTTDGREQAGVGVDAGDCDGDGRLDIVKTNFSQDYTALFAARVMASSSTAVSDRALPRRRGRIWGGVSGSSIRTTTAGSICSLPTAMSTPTSGTRA